jgi:hypothetical protein
MDYNTINYDVTMEDPNVLSKRWNTHSTIMLRNGTRVREDECVGKTMRTWSAMRGS